jgi:hypothetical protein
MVYAAETKVPVEQSRVEIERTLARYGADRFAFMSEAGRAIIMFEANNRRLKFDLPLPAKKPGENDASRKTREQMTRSRWRALLLCIKAKLEAVESKIETFEEAFMAHVVMPDGRTVGDHIVPEIARAYETGSMVALLPPPKASP